MSKTYVIYANSFDENSGGALVLHRLCDLLNQAGVRALLWPSMNALFDPWRPFHYLHRRRMERRWRRKHGEYRTFPGFHTAIATAADVRDAIVIYPEVVDGNPLQARHVVRWLLHKPGFHTGRINYGKNDKFFFFQNAFNDPSLNPDPDNLLRTVFIRDDIYKRTNFGDREGVCYILRKGAHRPMIHDTTRSIKIDGLSHREAAAVFNRVKTCISYDPYTMYSQFAALCGCDSIVVPEEGMSLASWYPDERDRYGVALGWDNLDAARESVPLLLPRLKEQEIEANQSVRRFIEKCELYFGS
ncbi:hypothetical protein [Leptothrix discophora]|uniref:WavQ n=1 Tax=Leptothrix discophora TaxID=89 RepID=A0ABT9G685_LEPDI|nr:hypothetical protein [Leptothrix discophora]MDP4301996.1 hypothetical protein [Leptothrix discophora]